MQIRDILITYRIAVTFYLWLIEISQVSLHCTWAISHRGELGCGSGLGVGAWIKTIPIIPLPSYLMTVTSMQEEFNFQSSRIDSRSETIGEVASPLLYRMLGIFTRAAHVMSPAALPGENPPCASMHGWFKGVVAGTLALSQDPRIAMGAGHEWAFRFPEYDRVNCLVCDLVSFDEES